MTASLVLRKRRRGGRAHQRNECKHLQCFHRDYLMFPARGERIERKAPPKILMQAQIGPPLFFNTSPRLSRKKCQPISPRSGEEHDASNQDVSRSRMPPIIRPERVAYFHVELDSRDVIVAEGPRSWKRATKTVPRLPMPIGQKPSLAPTRQRLRCITGRRRWSAR